MIVETDAWGRVETGQSIDGQPVYLSTKQAAFSVEYKGRRDNFMTARTLAQLRESYAVREADEQAGQAKEAQRRQQAANPVPVSVVDLESRSSGDYMLVGWHATARTPLLRKQIGTKLQSSGLDSSVLRRKKLLTRLTEEEWAQWEVLQTALFQARDDRQAMQDRTPTEYHTQLDGLTLVLTESYRATDPDPLVRVPYRLEGDELVAEVNDTWVRAMSVQELGGLILALVHPDAGKPALMVDRRGSSWRQGIYEPGKYPDQNVYLGLTGQEYDAVVAASRDAREAADKFIRDHAFKTEAV
jgi:hypothetical protein